MKNRQINSEMAYSSAGILDQSMEARNYCLSAKNRVGLGLSYRPDSLYRLHHPKESIPRFLKSLKIQAQASRQIVKDDLKGVSITSDTCYMLGAES
jgi:hypothetical protein